MEKFFLSKKMSIIILSLSIMSFVASYGLMTTNNAKIQKRYALETGSGTCFQRVTQTFTSLMIKDLASPYLQKEFMNTTSECYSAVSASFKDLETFAGQPAKEALNSLQSDLFWFHEKVQKLSTRQMNTMFDFSESNVTRKFSSLEKLKMTFEQGVEAAGVRLVHWQKFAYGINLFSVLLFIAFIATRFLVGRKEDEKIRLIEKTADESLNKDNVAPEKIDRMMDIICQRLQIPKTAELFAFYHHQVRQNQYRPSPMLENRPLPRSEFKNPSYFQKSMQTAFNNLMNKSFAQGIMVDADLDDEFYVAVKEEPLEQLLYSVIQYSIDLAQKSQSQEKRLSMSSKVLGPTAYLRLKVDGPCFTSSELEFINGTVSSTEGINMNLVLTKEMAKDAKVSFAIKNKTNVTHGVDGVQVDLVFDCIKVEEKKKEVKKVVKGSKKDIKAFLSSDS